VSDRFVYEDSEGQIDDTFFESVKRKRTQKSWVEQQLGPPDWLIEEDNSREIWTYRFTQARYNRVRFLFVFRYSAVEESSEYYHVVFCDSRVWHSWFDEFKAVQPEQLSSKARCNHPEKNNQMEADAHSILESDNPHLDS
jgi:hypothetical protein